MCVDQNLKIEENKNSNINTNTISQNIFLPDTLEIIRNKKEKNIEKQGQR